MIASLFYAGFDVVDVTVTDILGERSLELDSFRGLIFPGGFSFADVLGSARGWAASMKFNRKASEQLQRFKSRSDTFSLGVCNGCQLLALMGWVGSNKNGESCVLSIKNSCLTLFHVNLKKQEIKELYWILIFPKDLSLGSCLSGLNPLPRL